MQEARDFKAEIFKALANPLRIALLDAMREGECTVSELTRRVGLENAVASQQLSVLRAKNLVRYRKDGNFVHYSVAHPAVFGVLDAAWSIFEAQVRNAHRVVEAAAAIEPLAGSDGTVPPRPTHLEAAASEPLAGGDGIPADERVGE